MAIALAAARIVEMIGSGEVYRPKVVETLVIDLAKYDGYLGATETRIIQEKTDWRFRLCVFYPNGVKKAVFTRFV